MTQLKIDKLKLQIVNDLIKRKLSIKIPNFHNVKIYEYNQVHKFKNLKLSQFKHRLFTSLITRYREHGRKFYLY